MLSQQLNKQHQVQAPRQRCNALRTPAAPLCKARRSARLQAAPQDEALVLVDPAPITVADSAAVVVAESTLISDAAAITSDGAPASSSTTPSSSSDSSSSRDGREGSAAEARRSAAKLALLQAIAGTNRGALASDWDKTRVEMLVAELEATGGPASSAEQLEGTWELLYSNVEAFRASPFFPAFANGLVQNEALADAIFAFTDAIPGASIGSAYQTISSLAAGGSLVSKVDMAVFPGFKGTVVTTARAYPEPPSTPTRLALLVESTRVESSNFSPWLDGIAVPVEQLVERLRGFGATRVEYEISFVDEQLRVTRSGRQLMVHRRV